MSDGVRPTADWWPSLVLCPRCQQADGVLSRPWRGDGGLRTYEYRCTCGNRWWCEQADA